MKKTADEKLVTIALSMQPKVFDSILEAARVEGISANEFVIGAAAVRVVALTEALALSMPPAKEDLN